jgi:phosphopantetheinyl transferase
MKYYFYECNETSIEKQRALARCLFKYATGLSDYAKDERGKPYIPNNQPGNPAPHMSISHCRAGVACIIAEEPVGIDVEEISRMNLKIARRICTPDELKLIEEAENKQEFLCRLWVMKEAYSKMTGNGFLQGFSTINTIENKQLYAIRKDDVYIGIAATSALNSRPAGSFPSLL